jgi:hypothetical protein
MKNDYGSAMQVSYDFGETPVFSLLSRLAKPPVTLPQHIRGSSVAVHLRRQSI